MMCNDIFNVKDKDEAVRIQNKLKELIVKKAMFKNGEIKTVAGVDLAYWKQREEEYAVCCIVVIDYNTKKVLEKVHSVEKITFPYIPGCLAFRELPVVLTTIKKLDNEIDLYFFDGNGYLHPRNMGIATHAGIYLNKPTIGVAKSYYKIEDTDFILPENHIGAYTDIVIRNTVYGRTLRTQVDTKPIFISIGNFMDIDTATRLVKQFITKESHIPMPTRLADIETHLWRKIYQNSDVHLK